MNRASNSSQKPSSADWKQRYLDLQAQQEKQQARYKRKSSLLVDSLVQLIQFGRGLDSAADDKLLAMRGLIRQKSFKNVDLALVAEALELQLETSLKERKNHQKKVAQQLTLLTKRVQNTTQHRDLQNELSELKKAIEATPIQLATVASHLGRLSDLHALALKQTKSETGILQRWFGPEPASSEPLSKDSLGETTELSLDTIAGCLMRLLDDIEPRNEMQSTLEIASDLLASGLAEDNMELAIQSVTDVVLSAMSSDRFEMTGYLTQMNERLQEATMGLSASQQLLKEERAVGQHFGRAMQESAQGMREEVSADHDLPALKACINQNLDLMMSAVDEHHNQGNSLQAALSEQLEALVNRAKVLEVQGQEAERRVAEQRRRALTDNLTGLPNREAYEETAAREVQRWQRYDRPLCLAVCDIDLFKAVNDSYGHAAGDEVLRQLASILGKRLRGTDFVARYGGEEFVVLLPETDREQAEGVMESLREGIEQSQIKWEKKDLQLTVSIGIADFKGKDILQSAFARADRALYQAKTNGRNQVQLALD
ncbi:MAG: diguanylate cyclase [Litorivivens sp.]|jgi:diguanylate cyclase